MSNFENYAPAETVRIEFEDYAGNPTGEWLNVRRIDSQEVVQAYLEYNRAVAEGADQEKLGTNLLCIMIESWSFDDALSTESVQRFATVFPAVVDRIITAAQTKANFVAEK